MFNVSLKSEIVLQCKSLLSVQFGNVTYKLLLNINANHLYYVVGHSLLYCGSQITYKIYVHYIYM